MGASPLQKCTHNSKIRTHFLNGIKILDYSQQKRYSPCGCAFFVYEGGGFEVGALTKNGYPKVAVKNIKFEI